MITQGIIFFLSCSKDEPSCETYKTGTVTISNSSSNPYNIYVDGAFKITLNGNSISEEIDLNEGNGRQLYAVQVSGYLFSPTERETTFNVLRCTDYTWQIP